MYVEGAIVVGVDSVLSLLLERDREDEVDSCDWVVGVLEDEKLLPVDAELLVPLSVDDTDCIVVRDGCCSVENDDWEGLLEEKKGPDVYQLFQHVQSKGSTEALLTLAGSLAIITLLIRGGDGIIAL